MVFGEKGRYVLGVVVDRKRVDLHGLALVAPLQRDKAREHRLGAWAARAVEDRDRHLPFSGSKQVCCLIGGERSNAGVGGRR